MKKLLVPPLLAALAAVQLVHVERVEAQSSNPASTAPADAPSLVVHDASASVIPTANAKFCREEFEAALKRPYVIEPPDILSIAIKSDSATSDNPDLPQSFYLVPMDGKIDLGVHGRLYVARMMIEQARAAIEKKVAKRLENPKAFVDVQSGNSKVYYIITKGAGDGDTVTRQPITGNETVIDAVSVMGGIPKDASMRMWIGRPAPNGVGCEQILPVNWNDIAGGASTATNYQLMPGDRVFVRDLRKAEDAAAPAPPPAPTVATTVAAAAPSTAKPQPPVLSGQRQVIFDIRVIEDAENSMAEFEPLRENGFMLADASTTLGALRILEKHQLIKYLAHPQLVTTLGRPAQISVGELTPEADDGEKLRNGTHVKVSAEQDKDRLLVQWLVRISDNGTHIEGASKTAMASGQTAVYKVGPPSKKYGKHGPPVYVVMTPTFVK